MPDITITLSAALITMLNGRAKRFGYDDGPTHLAAVVKTWTADEVAFRHAEFLRKYAAADATKQRAAEDALV